MARGRLTRPPQKVWRHDCGAGPAPRREACPLASILAAGARARPPSGGGAAGARRGPPSGRAGGAPARPRRPGPWQLLPGSRQQRSPSSSRRPSTCSRKRPTRSERKKSRSRASARQKGAMAAEPRAGSTITSLWVILLDAPDPGAEGEGVPHRALPDELLVQLAQAGAVLGPQVVVAAVRDRAAGHVDEPSAAPAGAHRALHPVHGQARRELADPAVGVAAGEHLEHQVEVAARQVAVGPRGAQDGVELLQVPGLGDGHRQDHLGEHVERRSHRPGRAPRSPGRAPPGRPPPPPGSRGRRSARGCRGRPRPPGGRRGRPAGGRRRPRTASGPAPPRRARRRRCPARASWWRRSPAARPA